MRSRWGIVLMVLALVAAVTSVAMLAGCPAQPDTDTEPMPPPEDVAPPPEDMEPPVEEMDQPAEGEATDGDMEEPAEDGAEAEMDDAADDGAAGDDMDAPADEGGEAEAPIGTEG